ncbi:MAG: ATP-binding cassette domain-containing protein [FCB group bacterium]|nr:ATP-binding cassette domain-containing protein [FCB group bacterium]
MIRYENIAVTFDGRSILRNFDLTIRTGEKVIIRGKSGRGKTTLLNLLLGFVRPDEGQVILDGIKITPETIWSVRTRLAFVGQSVDLGKGKVRELLEQIFDYDVNRPHKPTESGIHRLFEQFDLDPDKLDKDFGDLSGGEKQRVGIILAILLKRKVYLLDEVTSALDKTLKEKVIRYFLSDCPETVIAISHDKGWETAGGVRIIDLGEL